jgi:hypothetical protein
MRAAAAAGKPVLQIGEELNFRLVEDECETMHIRAWTEKEKRNEAHACGNMSANVVPYVVDICQPPRVARCPADRPATTTPLADRLAPYRSGGTQQPNCFASQTLLEFGIIFSGGTYSILSEKNEVI